jgi:hypothetical protein
MITKNNACPSVRSALTSGQGTTDPPDARTGAQAGARARAGEHTQILLPAVLPALALRDRPFGALLELSGRERFMAPTLALS